MCSFCQNEKESLFHLFWECSKTCFFWNSVFSWMQSCNIIDKENIPQADTCLGLRLDASKYSLQINFCFLTSKYFIRLCRFKECNPMLVQYLRYLQHIYELEKKNTSTRKKWELLLPSLQQIRETPCSPAVHVSQDVKYYWPAISNQWCLCLTKL